MEGIEARRRLVQASAPVLERRVTPGGRLGVDIIDALTIFFLLFFSFFRSFESSGHIKATETYLCGRLEQQDRRDKLMTYMHTL